MIGLPKRNDLVKIWPYPGRLVQAGPRPVDAMGAGRFLPTSGEEVMWSEFYLEQLRAGDILLHEPPKQSEEPRAAAPAPAAAGEEGADAPPAPKPKERKLFDPAAAARTEREHRERDEAARASAMKKPARGQAKPAAAAPAPAADETKDQADSKDKG